MLSVIYLVFNEGYAATTGEEPLRAALCEEAIRLGRIIVELMPGEAEVMGLLALMLLHDSHHAARTDPNGELVTLEDQDRRKWNQAAIDTGSALLHRGGALGPAGPYQIQAAISAIHARAADHEATDWAAIVDLYDRLHALNPSPVIALNRAVALSFADGPDAGPNAGLAALDSLNDDVALGRYQPYHAARADLLRRAGQNTEAAGAYGQALMYTTNAAEQRFLQGRLTEVSGD